MPDDFMFVKRSNRTPARPVECKADDIDKWKQAKPEEHVIYMCIQWPEIRNILAEQRHEEHENAIALIRRIPLAAFIITLIESLLQADYSMSGSGIQRNRCSAQGAKTERREQ